VNDSRSLSAGSRALAWGRLLRVSLAPSAAADIAAGVLVGSFGDAPPLRTWPLFAASLAVYHGGMVLNDWNDREHDAALRSERPIPSGAISARTAAMVGFGLELAALAFAALISWRAAAWFGGIAVLVLLYDLAGRGPWLGPLLLGACRAANLGAGLAWRGFLASEPVGEVPRFACLLALLYGAYVFCASRVARLEDVADEREIGAAPRWWLAAAALLLVAPACVDPYGRPGLAFHPIALALGLAGALALARTAFATQTWTRADCGRATGMALRRLLVFTAALAVAADTGNGRGWLLAALILAGYFVSGALRRVFPPT
jgi:4-hydroxybenzoate polyprenyltransferase